MRYSEMFRRAPDPGRRLNRAPHQIQGGPATTAQNTGWGPAPTGYYPDYQDSHPGNVANPGVYPTNIVLDPVGTPGGPVFPTEPGDRADRVDQHPVLHVTATWTPSPYGNGRYDGEVDPLVDGPPRPELYNMSLHYHRESGASHTSFRNVPDGRRFPVVGSQDGSSTTYYVDSAASMAPYAPGTPGGQMPDSYRQISPGPAHGWSEVPVMNAGREDLKKMKALKQQQNAKQNRLANSTYAGQTYSQSTAHVANPTGGTVPALPWWPNG